MRLCRAALTLLVISLSGPAVLGAQDEPLAAGSEGVPVPKRKKHVQPVYPKEALAQGIRGIVILDLVIDPEGRVVETNIIRSIPGLDEAAIAAARQWVYEVTKIDGRPVSVRLTVPITFALKLPDLSRQEGIPELRQGVTPPWPEGERGGGRATADVTLEPDGRIGVARILEGAEPWSVALLQALRTWRFGAPPADEILSFRVEADFIPGRGSDERRVNLRLTGLRASRTFEAPAEPSAETAALEVPPAGGPEAPAADQDSAAEPSEPSPSAAAPPATAAGPAAPPGTEAPTEAAAEPAPPAESEPPPVSGATPADTPPVAPETPELPSAPPEVPAAPEAPASPPAGPPATATAPPAVTAAVPGPAPAEAPAAGAADPTAPPPVEVITIAPPPPPPENGISAIRDVTLEPGVPDLTRGRRPVSPPLARMAQTSGVVRVDFSVSAGGVTAVQRVEGPEILRPAAQQAVESWVFRRTRADRAYLRAVFTYEVDVASAVVRPQPTP